MLAVERQAGLALPEPLEVYFAKDERARGPRRKKYDRALPAGSTIVGRAMSWYPLERDSLRTSL